MGHFFARALVLASALLLTAGVAEPASADCPLGCDDANPCTDDICDPQAGCVHSVNTLPCTDGNACTTNDACNGGVCVGGDTAPGCTACNAIATFPPAGGLVRGRTSGTSTLTASCGVPNNNAPERVFRWTPQASGMATFKTCSPNTLFDSVVSVRTGSCTGPESRCNDDGPCGTGVTGSEASSAALSVTAGTTYYVVVDGWNGSQGQFDLSVTAPTGCGNNVREGAEQCDGTDHAACSTGQCSPTCACIQPGSALPDLVPSITDWFLAYDSTAAAGDVAEGCAESTTGVDLLRFGMKTTNAGTADLFVGPPGCSEPCTAHPLEICSNPQFICSPAAGHNHAHYTNFAKYELLDQNSQTLVTGHKQGFCLLDGVDAGPCADRKFTCTNQGLSKGCADLYESTLGCQYLDVTGLPGGTYTLRTTADPFNTIAELDDGNNVQSVQVTLPTSACASPTVLLPGGGSVTGTTAGASTLVGTCAATGTSPEKVYSWTPSTSGTAILDTCDASATAFDTVLYVRGASCKAGTELACNNDTTGCNTAVGAKGSRVTLSVTAGQTYYVAVDGLNGAAGSYKLNVTPPSVTPPPPGGGGTCASPIVIPAAGGVVSGVTSGTSALSGNCGSSQLSPEKVYQWTPTKSGTATIETCSASATGFDTVLYMRKTTCSSGSQVACNDDAPCATTGDPGEGSRIRPSVTAGTTYYIVVDGWGGEQGSFQLSVTPP
jgi:hypothetical protein